MLVRPDPTPLEPIKPVAVATGSTGARGNGRPLFSTRLVGWVYLP